MTGNRHLTGRKARQRVLGAAPREPGGRIAGRQRAGRQHDPHRMQCQAHHRRRAGADDRHIGGPRCCRRTDHGQRQMNTSELGGDLLFVQHIGGHPQQRSDPLVGCQRTEQRDDEPRQLRAQLRDDGHGLILRTGIGPVRHRDRSRPLARRAEAGDQPGGRVQPQPLNGQFQRAEQSRRQQSFAGAGRVATVPGPDQFRGGTRRDPRGHRWQGRDHGGDERVEQLRADG